MKIVLTGGGSGGHITPLMVVASELKRLDSSIKIIYVGQKGDDLAYIPKEDKNIDQVFSIKAGKLRRYHSEGLKQLLHFQTVYRNIRDMFYIFIGFIQSYLMFRKIKPDLVFSRGGYVSVPVCLGAKLNGIKYITHESDPFASLTNKILERWSTYNLVAGSKDVYPNSPDKTIVTGIPISRLFVPITTDLKREYRQKLNIDQNSKLVFIIGGGQGAVAINDAVGEILANTLAEFPDLTVVQVVGRKNHKQVTDTYDSKLNEAQRSRIIVLDFTDKVYLYSGAADVVITRAGATNLAEFETQGVACIIIPSVFLVSGHQLKNAEDFVKNQAAVVINDQALEANPHLLAKEISNLLKDSSKRNKLADNLSKLAHPLAGKRIAELIIKAAGDK